MSCTCEKPTWDEPEVGMCDYCSEYERREQVLSSPTPASAGEVVAMLLYCPKCGLHHIDEPDERTPDWTNPPHKSHLCHGCGCIWRPADVPTEGVAHLTTTGKADTWEQPRAYLTYPDAPANWHKLLTDVLDTSGARGTYHALKYAEAVERAEAALAPQPKAGEGEPCDTCGRPENDPECECGYDASDYSGE